MSRENVDLVRGMYEAWLRNGRAVFDNPAATGIYHPEFELHPDPDADWVGVDETYRGSEGMRKYMTVVYEAFEDYRPEVEDLLDVGDTVVTLAIEHGRGRDSGAEVQAARTAHVWTIRDGKAVRLDLYLDRARALEAVGLSE
jgi:ketosteroid isomerase-like protein